MAIKDKNSDKHAPAKDKTKPAPSKVVVRRLPADMSAETFQQQVSPLPDHDYLLFVPADPGLGQHAFARAYINFRNQEDIVLFRDRFDGYVFVDQRGFDYPAVVEYAPCQRIPRRRSRKPDAKAGTIGEDADYKAFLEAAEVPEEPPPSWEATLEEIEKRQAEIKENNAVAPLVSYVVKRRVERREERRRRELDRRKEEARIVKPKTAKEKVWSDEKESRYETVFVSKKYQDQFKEKHGKDGRLRKDSYGEREDKYAKRKERADKWKDAEYTPKREEKYRKEKEYRREGDWEEKRKPEREKKSRSSEPSAESSSLRRRGSTERMDTKSDRERPSTARSEPASSDSGRDTVRQKLDAPKSRPDAQKAKQDAQKAKSKEEVSKAKELSKPKEEVSKSKQDSAKSSKYNEYDARRRSKEDLSLEASKSAEGKLSKDESSNKATTSEESVRSAPWKEYSDSDLTRDKDQDSRPSSREDGSRKEAAGAGSSSEETKSRRDASSAGDRKIRNKDRPDLAIYRPGMGKYSSRRLQERETRSSSPTPAAGSGGGSAAGAGDAADADGAGSRRTLVFRRSRAANAAE